MKRTKACGVVVAVALAMTIGTMSPAEAAWTALTNAPPGFLDPCLLLTNGTAMCHEYRTNRWHRLSPDVNGSYANGTWNSPPIASMPNGNDPAAGCNSCTYNPLFFASAVLPDGQVIVIGGEFLSGVTPVRTNIGFLYNPVTDSWSRQLTEVFGSGRIGDAMGTVLADGRFVLSDILSSNMEVFDPATLAFTALNPTGKLEINNEENWNILPDGTILTVNARIPSSFEIYNPVTNSWGNSGSTVVNLADVGPGTGNNILVGPSVLRPDGRLVSFSGNSRGQNALYDTATGTWSNTSAMDFPLVPGQTFHFAVADGPAALLPNGNVLVMASPVINGAPFNRSSHFYEFSLTTNTLTAVADSPNAASFVSFQGHFLVLPSGEIMLTAFDQVSTQDVMMYSNGEPPQDSWRPGITSAPPQLIPGTTYPISGTLFNGLSEGATYGNDAMMATNYPLVRIVNVATGHVFYARTHDHSRMGVQRVGSSEVITTRFDVPPGVELGASNLFVVANGIASAPVTVTVAVNRPPVARCRNATVPANAACRGTATAADVNNGSSDPDGHAITCTISPSGPLALGNSTVTLSCVDPSGAVGVCTSTVTVVDNTPPTLVCPVSVNLMCSNASGAVASFSATATDNCGAVGTTTCSLPSGGTFPLGTRLDTCVVSDGRGNSGSCSFNVTVALGDNPICCPAGTNVILGDSNNNSLNGTSGSDCILGRGGQDTINGNGGNDFISAGDGDDIVSGGAGNDLLFCGSGQDRATGDPGNDLMSGGDGDDQLSGGDGADTLLGGSGQDRLFGDNDNDTVVGETGDDRLEGGAGDDLLIGGGLHDVCIGAAGTDTFLTCESATQ